MQTTTTTMADAKVENKMTSEVEVETTQERKPKRSPKAPRDSGDTLNAGAVEKEFHSFVSRLQTKYPGNMLAYQLSNLSEVSQTIRSRNVEYIYYDMK